MSHLNRIDSFLHYYCRIFGGSSYHSLQVIRFAFCSRFIPHDQWQVAPYPPHVSYDLQPKHKFCKHKCIRCNHIYWFRFCKINQKHIFESLIHNSLSISIFVHSFLLFFAYPVCVFIYLGNEWRKIGINYINDFSKMMHLRVEKRSHLA